MDSTEAAEPSGDTRSDRWFIRLARLVVPEENPAGVVYGTIVAGALLAAEAPRHETLPSTAGAVVVSLALYWIAHTYAHNAGDRAQTGSPWTVSRLLKSAGHEFNIIKGALVPLLVLLMAWAIGAGTSTAVRCALVSSVVMLFLVELTAALRSSRRPASVVLGVLVSVLLGLGVLTVNVLLH
ncbi:MAG: hypothetical protein ACLQNG_18220 [Acidimicrobiales bacterium]|jgi:hypothetical protein